MFALVMAQQEVHGLSSFNSNNEMGLVSSHGVRSLYQDLYEESTACRLYLHCRPYPTTSKRYMHAFFGFTLLRCLLLFPPVCDSAESGQQQ